MGLMEKITNMTLRQDGYAPTLVIWLVRVTMFLIWFSHDVFFAPLCGRGDGRSEADDEPKHESEKLALLAREGQSLSYIV